MVTDTVSKRVILEELEENTHPEMVEDVIVWALEYYAENKKENTWGKTIAGAIVNRIKTEEAKENDKLRWQRE
ncbi:hypothetical protein [Myroides odoratus]|uniref:hypothetical protein n=1 Tax=Myroides odoratus TaxID=256 RepID=UPI0039AEE372